MTDKCCDCMECQTPYYKQSQCGDKNNKCSCIKNEKDQLGNIIPLTIDVKNSTDIFGNTTPLSIDVTNPVCIKTSDEPDGGICIKTAPESVLNVNVNKSICTFTTHNNSPCNKPGISPDGLNEKLHYFIDEYISTSNFGNFTNVLSASKGEIVSINKIEVSMKFVLSANQNINLDLDPGCVEIACNATPESDPTTSQLIMEASELSDWILLSGSPILTTYTDFGSNTVLIYRFVYNYSDNNGCKLTLSPGGALELRYNNKAPLCTYFDQNLKTYGLRIFYCRERIFCDLPKNLPIPLPKILKCELTERIYNQMDNNGTVTNSSIDWLIDIYTNVPTTFYAEATPIIFKSGVKSLGSISFDSSTEFDTNNQICFSFPFTNQTTSQSYVYSVTVTDIYGNTEICSNSLVVDFNANPISITNLSNSNPITWDTSLVTSSSVEITDDNDCSILYCGAPAKTGHSVAANLPSNYKSMIASTSNDSIPRESATVAQIFL